jgi:hypothetical protein
MLAGPFRETQSQDKTESIDSHPNENSMRELNEVNEN